MTHHHSFTQPSSEDSSKIWNTPLNIPLKSSKLIRRVIIENNLNAGWPVKFEALGAKMKVEPSDNQLTGLGFSTTQKASVICKVDGSFKRIIKINF